MRAFAELLEALDTTRSVPTQIASMVRYLSSASAADAAWATCILSGRRISRLLAPAQLRRWLDESAGLPAWLIEETLAEVADLAESIALLMARTADVPPQSDIGEAGLAEWIEERLLPLRSRPEAGQRERVVAWWRMLGYRECFLLNRLLTGGLRPGVSEAAVVRAVSEAISRPHAEVARRLSGSWEPSEQFWRGLQRPGPAGSDDAGDPYPFMLASPLEGDPAQLGDLGGWLPEWKWDGLRAQFLRRAGHCSIWLRGEELVSERFPELLAASVALPDCVLDGEIVAWQNGPRPRAELQPRCVRRTPTGRMLAEIPVRLLAFDLLELDGTDLRGLALRERRARLELILSRAEGAIRISPVVAAASWSDLAARRAQAHARGAEGLVIKALDSSYGAGRQGDAWWQWQCEPWTCEAVLLHVRPGSEERTVLCGDCTFGVWRGAELVPIARTSAGLSEQEGLELDRWIRAHTRERFGPVRSVEPSLVFELSFESVARSARHESGLVLRLPRVVRRRPEVPACEASSLDDLLRMLPRRGATATALRDRH